MRKLAFPILVFSISLGAQGATILVPAHQPTIQAAINAAASGDTIEIAAGTYVEDLWIPGSSLNSKNNLTIQPVSGAQVTIEAANTVPTSPATRGLLGLIYTAFGIGNLPDHHGIIVEGAGTTFRNLTIRNYTSTGNPVLGEGATMTVMGDNCTIQNCILEANPDNQAGQCILVITGSYAWLDPFFGNAFTVLGYSAPRTSLNLSVTDSTLRNGDDLLQTVDFAFAMGIFLTGNVPPVPVVHPSGTFTNSQFERGNDLAEDAVGNYIFNACSFHDARDGFRCAGGNHTFTDCRFERSSQQNLMDIEANLGFGGGLATVDCNRCVFCGGSSEGRLVRVSEGIATFSECIFNVTATSPSVVAGIQYSPGDIDSDFTLIGMPAETRLTIDHCDFFSPDGRGVYADDLPAVGEPPGNLSIMNSILACAEPVAFASVTGPSAPNATIQYNDLFTGGTQISNPLGSWNVTSANNLNANPLYDNASLCDPAGFLYHNVNLATADSSGGHLGASGFSGPALTETATPTHPTPSPTETQPTPQPTATIDFLIYPNPQTAGVNLLMADILPFKNSVTNLSNWEPYTTAFGDGTLALAANTEAEGDLVGITERAVVAFFNTDGSVLETDGFFTESSTPWTDNNDIARVDGNPPRIAGDKRDGGTKYLLGNECTPWAYPNLFPNYGSGFTYSAQVASVQLFNRSSGLPVPLNRLIDPTYGQWTQGIQNSQIRFGGEIRGLSNGNFVVVTDDRTTNLNPIGLRAAAATIVDGQDGSPTQGEVIFGPFNANQGVDPTASTGIWSNVAAFNGGFAVRPDSGALSAAGNRTIGFWDNSGNPLGTWEAIIRTSSLDPLPPYGGTTTSINSTSGAASRIDSDIQSSFIYLAGRGVDFLGNMTGGVYITKIRASDRTTVKEAYVTDGIVAAPDRVNVCSDKDDNVFVCWMDYSLTGNPQVLGRFYDSNLEPVTGIFLVFQGSEPGPTPVTGFNARSQSCSMVSGRLLVTARVMNPVPVLGLDTNDHIATVLQVPNVALPPSPTSTPTHPSPTPTNSPTPPTPTPTRTPNPLCPNPIFVSGGSGLQAAINAAQPGCVIEIQDSLTYYEDIYIPPSKPFLTIRAAAGQTPTIKAVNMAHHRGLFGISHVMIGAPIAPDHLGVIIEADGTALQGLILVNDGPGNQVFDVSSAATVAADGVSFQSCTIRGGANTFSDNVGLLILTGDWTEFETHFPGVGFVSAGYSTIRCDDLTVVDCLFDRAAIELASVDYATTLGLTIGTFYNPVIHPRDGTFFRCTFTGGDEIAQNAVGTGFLYLDCDFQGNTGEFTQEGGSAYFVDCRFSSFGLGSGLLDLRADLGFGGGVADITATNCTFCGSGGAELVDIDEGNAAFQHCIFTSTDSRPDFPCIRYNPETYDNDFFNPLIPPSLTRPTSLRLENCDLHNPLGVGIATGSGAYDPPKPPGSILVTDTIIVANQPIQLLNPTVVPGSTLDIQYNDLFIESGWTEVTPGAWSGVIANNLHEDPAYEDPSQCDPAGFLYHNATLATAGMSGGQLGAVGFSGVSLTPTFTPTPTSTIPSPTPTPTSTCDPFSYPLLNPACAGASPLSENVDVWPEFLPLNNGFRNFDVAPLGPDPGTQQEEFILFGLAEEPSCGPAKVTISPQGIVRPKSNVYIDDVGVVVDMQGAAASFYGMGTGFGWNTHVDSDPETGQYVVGQHYNNDFGYAFPNTLAAFDYIQSGIPPVTLDHGIFQRFDRYGNKVSNLTPGRNIPSTVSHTELPYFPPDFHSSRINGVSILSDGNTLYSIADRSTSGFTPTDVGVVEYFRDHGIVPNLNSASHRCCVHTVTTPDASGFIVGTTPTFVDPATGLTTDTVAYQGVDAGEGFFAIRSGFLGGTLAVFRNDGTRIAQIFNYNSLIVSSGLLPYPNDGTLSLSSSNTVSCSNDTIYITALYRPQAGGVLRPCVLRFRVDNLQTVTPLPVIAGYEDSVATLDQVSANTMDVYATPEGDFALAWREGVGDGGAPVVRVFNQDGTPATSTFYPSSIPSPDMDIAYSAFSNSSATIKVALHDNTLCVVWLSENGVSTVSEPDCGGQPKLPALSTVARLFHVPVCESCPPPYYSVSLDEAVDSYSTPIWSYGDAAWTGLASASYDPTGNISVDGFDGAQSGSIGDNGWSTLATTVHGPGTASFYWKVSSEANHDFLTFLVDGFPVEQLSGSTDWAFFSTQVSSGPHSLEWRYEKDGSGSSGADLGRVDLFNWTYGCTTYVSGGVGLQDAINSTQSGCEIVILDSATYVEDLYIPPTKTNLTIRAQYGQTPVIRAANNTGNRGLIGILFNLMNAAGAPDHYGMIIEGNGTQLLGLTLENDGPANTPFGHGSAVLVMADNVRLESCTFRGASSLLDDQAGLALASGDWASLESLFPGAFTSGGYGVIRGDNLSVWYCNFDRGNIELATLDYANAFGLYVTGTYYNPVVHPRNGSFYSCVFSNGDRVMQNAVGEFFHYDWCTFQSNTGSVTLEGGNSIFANCDFRDNLSSTRPLVNVEADVWVGGGVSDVQFQYCRFCGSGGREFTRVEEGNADFQYCIFSSTSTDPAFACVRYNPQRFDSDFFTLSLPPWAIRSTSVNFNHCDLYNPMGVGLVTDAEAFDSPDPAGAIQIRNTIVVAHEGVNALHTSVVPGSLLTIENSDLWTSGAPVTNVAWPSVLSGNLSEDPLYRNPGPCDPYGYAHGNFAFVSRLPGGAGSQGYQQLIVSLPEALDNSDLVWETGGGAVWVGIDETSFNPGGETSFDGDDAARSGTLWDNETSFFQTAVSGPGMLDFEWRVSSELNHDVLSFLVDNAEYTQISGITGWQHVSLQISEGPHTLQWRYAKDGAGAAGLDLGRVDRAVWAPENHIPLSSADSSFLGEYQWGHSGSTVAGLGDVNGDEYDDFLIGAPGVTPVGKTYLIFGNESEFGSNNYLWYAPASFVGEYIAPYWRVNEVAGIGDVNGDGLNDFLIGARTPNHSNQIEVKAFLFHGDETDFGPDQPLSRADASFISPQISDIYPYRSPKFHVTGAGDVNADGFDDFLIGVGGNDEAGLNTGKVFLFFGNETDFSADTPLSDADASYSGESPFDELSSVAGVGDVNGDGFDDFLLGAFRNDTGGTGSGKSYLFLGNETDFGPNRSVTTADASFVGEYSADYSGFSVAGVGDMNGDGLDDFLIGAPRNNYGASGPYPGKIYLLFGRSSANWGQNFSLANADASFIGSQYASHLGDVVTGGMDVDGDGYDDLLIRGNKDFDSSYVYLIRGGIGPWIRNQPVETQADIVYQNEFPDDRAGASLSALPDVDGDGFGDFLVGAPYNSQGNYDAGKTYLVHGQPGAVSATYVRRQPGGNPIPEDFSSVRLSIDYAGGSSSIDVATLNRALPPNPPSQNQGTTLPMEWVIETDRLGPWTATVTFEYTNGELGGASESHLVVHQSPNGAPGSWQVAGISQARDPNRNVIRVQGIDSFSHFTIVDISTGGPAPMVSLPEALDNYDLTWITGGDAPWFGVGETTFNPNGETSFDGLDAARSGLIHDNETSFLQTEVVGPGTAGFYWRLSSETPFDTLEFYVDDALQGQFSGEIPWHPASIEVPSGPHTLKAVYSKNGSGSSGEDAARIDLASWTPGPPPPVSCPIYVSGGAGLQAAINAATSGCVIEIVDSLTYAEDLYIPPSKTNLTIRATTGETPTIRAANTTGGRGLVDLWFQLVGASGAPDHAGMIVEGNGATLRGLTFENDGPVNTVYNWNSAILVMADHVTLEGCTIRGSTFIPGDRVGLLVASGDWTNLETVTGPIFSSAGYGIVRCDHLTMSECTLDRGGIGLATVDYANALGLLLTGQTYYNPVVHPQDGSFTNCDFIGMNFAAQNAVGKGFVYQYCNILENDASFQQEGGNASFVNCRFSRSFIGQELFAVQADLGYGGGVADITCTNCVFCGGRMEMVEVTTANAIFSGCVFTNEATDSMLPCILYNPEEFGPEFYALPAPFEGARPTSLLVDHCDFHIPNSIAIGTNSGPYNPPHPPSSLQVTNSVIVSDRPISIINSTFVPGTTLDIQYNDLFTTGAQVVNTSGWPGTIANNLNVDPYFVDPNRCEQDGFLYANPSLGNAASDGGPIGSQGRWPIGGLAETDQPMLGRSPQHTGFTDRVGPEIEPEILWEAAPGLAQAAFATQAILDGSGNIYVNYGNVDSAPAPRQENFISFDSSGLERWRFGPISDVLRFGLSTAALNLGGQVVAAFRDDYARSFASATGTLSWETPVQGSLSPPAVDRFGFIYVSGAKLDPLDGSILWQFPGGTNSAMALSLDQRTVYFGQSATLYALDAGSGNVNWSFSPSPAARFGYGAPVVGADGTVYLSERTTGDFFAFEDNGYSVVVKWVFPTNHPGDSPRRSGLDQDTVYLGTVGSDVVLHAIGLDGVPKWSREFPSGTYVGDPCITDAAVYVTVDSEGGLYALDRDDGSLLWRRQVSPPGASFSEGVTLTDNGVLYVGTNGTLANPDQAVLVALQASSTPCLAVTLPEALSYPRGNQVTIPVEVGPVSDLSAITGLEVRFDPTILSLPSEDRLAPSSLLPDDWLIFANASEPGVVLVSGTGITPASGSGTLLTLTFDIVGNPGLCAPIFLSVGSFEDSNGASICTNTNDGWFCVTSEGTVTVEVEPDAGSWTLTGPEGFAPRAGSGDQTFSNAPVGMYTVTFDPLPGYITPPPASGELSSLGVLILSGSYTPTGSVSVEVEPDSATWTLTGPNGFAPYMGAGEETLPNAPVGAYQLVFDPLPNHLTPPSATGELVAFGSLILSGTYTPTGTVNVEVEPNSATWTLTGPVGFAPYSGSGDVSVPDAPVGNYSVAFDPLPGYLTPTSANGSLAPFGSLILSGTYTPTGVVSVQVEPDAATWTLTGPAGFSPQSSSGDQSFSDVPEGIYSLTFDPLPGYITPPSATGELAAFDSLILSGTYTPTGAVTVEVDPDSATWTLTGPAGFTPQAGAGDQTLPGVPVGIYTATFDPLPEYITPPSASGELTAFGALILSGTYTPTGTITVEVDPDVATWTLTGPTLFGSHSGAGDETIDDAPVGDYQVVFHAVSDYITPTSDSGALAASETLAFSGIYTPLLDISGRVAYCHDLASKPVPDATLELSPGWSERTDSTGLYAFESLPAGVSYTVTATRAIQPGDVAIPSITAFDASLILRHTVGLVVLNACQLNAADVNRSNTVTAFDASQILRFTVGLIPAPFVWLIEPPSRSYNPLLSDQFNQDYSAVLTGDVNGSWIYTGGAKSLEDSVSLKANSLEAPEAELSLGEHAGERGAQVIVELQATVDQLQAFTDLRITFDPAVLTVQGPSRATLAAPLEGWTLLSNAGEDPGLIRLSASGSAPVSASGAIVEILMEVIGAPGATSPLSLVGGAIENASGELLVASFQDGSFTVLGPSETPVPDATPSSENTPILTPSPTFAEARTFDAASLLDLIRAVADKEVTGETARNLFEFADRWMEPTR